MEMIRVSSNHFPVDLIIIFDSLYNLKCVNDDHNSNKNSFSMNFPVINFIFRHPVTVRILLYN